MEAHQFLTSILAFLTVSILVSILAGKIRIPYTTAMVLTGLAVSVLRPQFTLEHPARIIDPDLILVVFLPGLLFEASYHLDLGHLRRNLRPILLLAVPGVLISTGIVGLLLHWFFSLPVNEALLFGVLISATDPIAVTALFKELGVDKRLGILIEGESLFNDGVAIVVYTILVGIAAGTAEFHIGESVLSLFLSIAGGAALGMVAGLVFKEGMKRTSDPIINLALTTILAYGVYLLAEGAFGGVVSPVIAVVTAGVYVGNYGSRSREAARATEAIITFWEYAVFLINSSIFLLIGLQVDFVLLFQDLVQLVSVILLILAARAGSVYLLRLVINRKDQRLPLKWTHVLFWGGMRGAVSIALALSIPEAVQSRETLITLTFGYVLFSFIVQGPTMKPLLKRLGLTGKREKELEFETRIAQLASVRASLRAFDAIEADNMLPTDVLERIREHFNRWVTRNQQQINQLVSEDPTLADYNFQLLKREIASHQKQALVQLQKQGVISHEVYEEVYSRVAEHFSSTHAAGLGLPHELVEALEEYLRFEEYTAGPE